MSVNRLSSALTSDDPAKGLWAVLALGFVLVAAESRSRRLVV
jgi:hypothetical protein